MNIIKTNRRCSLQGGTISDLLEIHSQGPELSQFSADEAVALWYEDSRRRTTQNPRKKYKSRQNTDTQCSEDEEECTDHLKEWDKWLSHCYESYDSSGHGSKESLKDTSTDLKDSSEVIMLD